MKPAKEFSILAMAHPGRTMENSSETSNSWRKLSSFGESKTLCLHNRYFVNSMLDQGLLGDSVTTRLANKQYALYEQKGGQRILAGGKGFFHIHLPSQPHSLSSGIGILYSHFINESQKIKTICLSNKNQLLRIGARPETEDFPTEPTFTVRGRGLFGNEASGDTSSLLGVIIKIFRHPNAPALINQKGTSSKHCVQTYRCIRAK